MAEPPDDNDLLEHFTKVMADYTKEKPPITICIVSDDSQYLEELSHFITSLDAPQFVGKHGPRLAVVGAANTVEDAVNAALAQKPNVVLVDANSTRFDVIELAKLIARNWNQVQAHVVFIGEKLDAPMLRSAMEAGVVDSLEKSASQEEFYVTIRAAAPHREFPFTTS